RGMHAVVAPIIVKNFHGDKPHYPVTEPTRTFMTGNHHLLVAPYMVPRYGERPGQEPRTYAVDIPGPTEVPSGNGGSLAIAFLAQNNYQEPGHDPRDPVSTIVQKGSTQAVVAAGLVN